MDKTLEKVYKWKIKKWVFTAGIILSILGLIWGTRMMRLEISAGNIDSVENNEKIEGLLASDATVKAIVYTYSGEVYEISGEIEKYLSDSESADPIMELNGTLRNQGIEQAQPNIDSRFPDSVPLSLTVYTPSGEIYGFQTYHEVKLEQNQKGNTIELYGYLEGYYDGQEYYS